MQNPGLTSLIFLAYLLLFLPWAAMRSARLLAGVQGGGAALPSRVTIWAGTLVSQMALLFIAVVTGRGFGYPFLAFAVGPRHLFGAGVALALCFALRSVARAMRTEEERRGMAVYRIAPRTPGEWWLWSATILVGSIAEETAYRGVGVSVLSYALRSHPAAILICAIAFAVAHAVQGWKSGAVILGIALVMQALVEWSGTLLLVIVVHAAYDLVAGVRIARDAPRYAPESPAAAP